MNTNPNENESFIDENISELALHYDTIRGYNVNTARVSPSIYDGLKPVQRRALYSMYLHDGMKSFKKLATISGNTFGSFHPHSTVSISDAVVLMAQSWRNMIPLVEPNGNFGTCHSDDTQVLTRNGWKYFKDIDYSDKLASADPETGDLIFESPINIISYHYKGYMIHGCHKNLNFMVTPDHRMIIQTHHYNGWDKKFSEIKADDLPSYSRLRNIFHQRKNCDVPDIILSEKKIRCHVPLPELRISMENFVQFLGIFLADGYIYKVKEDYRIIIAGSKPRKVEFCSKLLTNMGFKYRQNE